MSAENGFIQTRRACRECGCTDEQACFLVAFGSGGPTCVWDEPDLCSACNHPELDAQWVHPAEPGGRIAKTHIADVLRSVDGIRWDRFIAGSGMVQVYGWIARDDDHADFLLIEFYEDSSIGFTTSSASESERISEQLGYPSGTHVPCQRVSEEFELLVPSAIGSDQ